MFTTNKTREASEQELRSDFEEVSKRVSQRKNWVLSQVAKKMLRSGTTTLEAKSGYGLNVEAEMKVGPIGPQQPHFHRASLTDATSPLH